MKVIAINGSPRMDKGNTALILHPFLEGMKEEGAHVEIFYTKKLTINPCQGEFICWLKTPGKCFQNDDMQTLLPQMAQADVWVLASPVYVDGITGPLKNLLDRIIPLGEPFFELRDGHCRHPGRKGVKEGKLVLVSNCGFWEMDNFHPLLVHMKAICKNVGRRFAGALLRPHGPVLKAMLEQGYPVEDILNAAREAGRQLIQKEEMDPQTLASISRELIPRDIYIEMANTTFSRILSSLDEK